MDLWLKQVTYNWRLVPIYKRQRLNFLSYESFYGLHFYVKIVEYYFVFKWGIQDASKFFGLLPSLYLTEIIFEYYKYIYF